MTNRKPTAQSVHDLHADLFTGSGEEDRFADPAEARKKAMDYLARREYARQELARKLGDAGFSPDAVEQAVSRLTDDGLQDDARFAEAFVRSRVNQGKGPVRIRADLAQRGVAASVIDAAMEEQDGDWRHLARQVREKKFGPGLPHTFSEKARQMRFLQYRGFEPGQIQAAVGGDDD